MPEYYYVRQQAEHCAARIAHSVQLVDITAQTFCHIFRAVKMAAAKAGIITVATMARAILRRSKNENLS
jgi:hypothetical protein